MCLCVVSLLLLLLNNVMFILDEDINGEAFVELTDNDLSEMGFKKGQRMKMLKIISSVKVLYTS